MAISDVSLSGLVLILKAAGIAAIAYVIYAITMGIFSFRRMKKLENIERKVILIEEKLDKLLKKKK